MEGENILTLKAKDLMDSFKTAEAKWIQEINQKDEFIRRRDHTIATQIETINSVSKEVTDLTEKNKNLGLEKEDMQKKLNVEQADKQKIQVEKLTLMKKYMESYKEAEIWKAKYNNLKTSLKEELKRRVDALCLDDEEQQPEVVTENAPLALRDEDVPLKSALKINEETVESELLKRKSQLEQRIRDEAVKKLNSRTKKTKKHKSDNLIQPEDMDE